MSDGTADGADLDDRPDEVSLERLHALSDGVFAIALTLLVLDIHVTGGLDPAGFHRILRELLPNVGAYAFSFAILANIWLDHRRIARLTERADRLYVLLTFAGLAAIALLPFPTTMLSEYASQPLAVAVYAGTIILVDLLQMGLLLTLIRRPRLARPGSAAATRAILFNLGATVLVFAATIPVAFASPLAALLTWPAQIPLKVAIDRRS